jgi:hypothetical protein
MSQNQPFERLDVEKNAAGSLFYAFPVFIAYFLP